MGLSKGGGSDHRVRCRCDAGAISDAISDAMRDFATIPRDFAYRDLLAVPCHAAVVARDSECDAAAARLFRLYGTK